MAENQSIRKARQDATQYLQEITAYVEPADKLTEKDLLASVAINETVEYCERLMSGTVQHNCMKREIARFKENPQAFVEGFLRSKSEEERSSYQKLAQQYLRAAELYLQDHPDLKQYFTKIGEIHENFHGWRAMSDPQKISVCTEYSYQATVERCRRMGNTDMYNCLEVPVPKTDTVCSDPAATLEAARQSLNLKLLELGKLHQAFREEENVRTIKVCADVAWERRGRPVTTGGKEIPEETLSLIHREKKKICTEAKNLEEAQKKWEEESAQFVKSYPHREYRDPHFQKIAQEAGKSLDWSKVITESKLGKFM